MQIASRRCFKAGEIEVSSVTAVHKAALSVQMLLYQAYSMQDEMKMTWNIFERENDIKKDSFPS